VPKVIRGGLYGTRNGISTPFEMKAELHPESEVTVGLEADEDTYTDGNGAFFFFYEHSELEFSYEGVWLKPNSPNVIKETKDFSLTVRDDDCYVVFI
jgi:hypothetical protein